jgi:transposase-like protein
MHHEVRTAMRNTGRFPGEEAVVKLVVLALRQAEAKWHWPRLARQQAKAQFAIQRGEGFHLAA